MSEKIKHEEYPIVKDPNRLYYVGGDGYVYSTLLQRGRKVKNGAS